MVTMKGSSFLSGIAPHSLAYPAYLCHYPYLRQGDAVDWKFVQERLGHASVVTTMQTYAHLNDEDRQRTYENYLRKRREVNSHVSQ